MESRKKGIVAVTGARGFIGEQCLKFFHDRGYLVRALVRDPSAAEGLRPWAQGGIFKADLPYSIDPKCFEGGVRALIHCAYETRFKSLKQAHEVNQFGTERLFEVANKNQVEKLVFISSMAAHSEAASYYGRSKWQIEESLDLSQSAVIKPGTVLGKGGIFERTREMIRKLPVLPVFFSGRDSHKKMQTVWIEDLCNGIYQVIDQKLSGKFAIAEEEGVSIPHFYRGIAALDRKKPWIVPFPGQLTLYALKAFEALGLRLPITSENLLGIKHLKHFDVRADLKRLGITVRNFQDSLKTLAQDPQS